MNIKAGWKTTEFWISVTTLTFGMCIIFGLFTSNDVSEIIAVSEKIVGMIITIGSVIGYSLSRGTAKQGAMNVNDLLVLIANIMANKSVVIKEEEKKET